jgi:hypothetical protein
VEEISIQSTRGFDLSASGNFYVRFLGGIENQFVSLPIAFVLGPVAVQAISYGGLGELRRTVLQQGYIRSCPNLPILLERR